MTDTHQELVNKSIEARRSHRLLGEMEGYRRNMSSVLNQHYRTLKFAVFSPFKVEESLRVVSLVPQQYDSALQEVKNTPWLEFADIYYTKDAIEDAYTYAVKEFGECYKNSSQFRERVSKAMKKSSGLTRMLSDYHKQLKQ